jgi:hypothetical protein
MSTTAQRNDCAPSYAQLAKFVKLRNESPFASNLQFACDATDCGFDVKDLGAPEKIELSSGLFMYEWRTPNGIVQELDGVTELIRM